MVVVEAVVIEADEVCIAPFDEQDFQLTPHFQAEDEVDSVVATEEVEEVSAVIEVVEAASLLEVATVDEVVPEAVEVRLEVVVVLPEVVEVVPVDEVVSAVKVPVPLRLNPTSTLVFSLPR